MTKSQHKAIKDKMEITAHRFLSIQKYRPENGVEKNLRMAMKHTFYLAYRSHDLDRIDEYHANVMRFLDEHPEYNLNGMMKDTLTELKAYVIKRKTACQHKRETKTKLYSITMSEAEYEKVLKFLEQERAK